MKRFSFKDFFGQPPAILFSTLVIGLCIVFSLFTRVYKLEETGTFFWDPAYDLRQIYSYYQEKNITLIGPISEDGNKVYGSLSYYLLMPFAVLGKFDVASTTYGAAFYGFVTAVMVIYLTYRLNKQLVIPMALLVAIWFPLIETSRWAWNPHLVLPWIALGLILVQYQKIVPLFLAGLAFGLTIHHHYLGFFATAAFLGLLGLQLLWQKKYRLIAALAGGYLFALLPFVLFDITHPPGLFLTRFLYFNQSSGDMSVLAIGQRIIANVWSTLQYYTHSAWLSGGVLVSVLGMAIYDWQHRRLTLQFLGVWLIQIIGVAFVNAAYPHYFLPGLLFFVMYVMAPREKWGQWLSYVTVGLLLVGSVLTVGPQITTDKYAVEGWMPNIKTVRLITNTMAEAIRKDDLKGVNVAVLGSTDLNSYGWKYRSLLEIQGITLMSRLEYFTNSYLFLVSQATEEELRASPYPEMHRFRKEKLRMHVAIPDSTWHVYLFSF